MEVREARQPVRLSARRAQSGVDAAKAISLGADLAGFGRGLLGSAVESVEALDQRLAQVELERGRRCSESAQGISMR